MDTEAPVDAWYVWLGVAAVSIGLAGLALSVPSTPPPDATTAANTIEETAASPTEATGEYDHDGTEARIGERRLWLRADGTQNTARIAYGRMVPVSGDEQLRAVLDGDDATSVYDHNADRDAWAAFHGDVEDARDRAEDPEWRPADGTVRVRTVAYPTPGGETHATLVAA